MIYAILKIVTPEKIIRECLDFFCISCRDIDVKNLSVYMEELMRWNKKINLTGIRDMENAVRELLCDALFLTGHTKGHHSILDLGSGAGILAIPISIVNGNAAVFSIDKSLRKIQFQRHIKRMLHLDNFTPLHGRAEDIHPLGVDCLVVKAFGAIPFIFEKGGLHLKPGGNILILKGKTEHPANSEGFTLEETIPYELPVILRPYKLFRYKKVSS